jgi:hypothetical protein
MLGMDNVGVSAIVMGFVIFVAGVGVLGTAISYAAKPTERKLGLLRPLSLAAIFAALCSTSMGLATALRGPVDAGVSLESMRVLFAGLSEALILPFVAFGFLAVAWLLVAVGLRRQE